jgi:hypothetical protein
MIRDGITRIEGSPSSGVAGGGGVPDGGFKDQVLVKKSNNSQDVGWTSPSALSAFDSSRPITRTNWPTSLNVSGTDVVSFLNAVFFPAPPFQELSFSLNTSASASLYEYGTSPSITLNTDIDLNGASYANNLQYISGASTVLQTIASPQAGSAKNTSTPFNIYPVTAPSATQGYSVSLHATLNGDNNGTPKTYTSNTEVVRFEAPYYYGVGISLTSAQMKTSLTKAPIELRSNKSVTFNTPTTKQNLYFVYPEHWGPLASIFANSFDSTNLFAASITGLTLSDGSTKQYRAYVSKNTTLCSNCPYTMNF